MPSSSLNKQCFMFKTSIINQVVVLLMFSFSISSYSQNKNIYCYYPKAQDKVIKRGAISFYVSSFNQTDLSQIEFTILENGNKIANTTGIHFTIDGPYEAGKPIDFSW